MLDYRSVYFCFFHITCEENPSDLDDDGEPLMLHSKKARVPTKEMSSFFQGMCFTGSINPKASGK